MWMLDEVIIKNAMKREGKKGREEKDRKRLPSLITLSRRKGKKIRRAAAIF